MQSYFATEAHIRQLMWAVVEAKLSAPEDFDRTAPETLRVIYNGIGPDCWSDRFRRLTTRLLAMFEPEALIHDWEYTFQPKTYQAFTAANARFAINAVRYALRYKRSAKYMLCGALLALLCQLFGWRGFKSASYPEMLREAQE